MIDEILKILKSSPTRLNPHDFSFIIYALTMSCAGEEIPERDDEKVDADERAVILINQYGEEMSFFLRHTKDCQIAWAIIGLLVVLMKKTSKEQTDLFLQDLLADECFEIAVAKITKCNGENKKKFEHFMNKKVFLKKLDEEGKQNELF